MEYQGQPVIVLGMGRSGTSILASLLQDSNVSMYRNSVPPGEINPRGFAEEASVVALHQKLKRLHYSRFEGDPDYDNPLIDKVLPFEPAGEVVSEAAALATALQRPGLWGWKDPRTVLFVDLWLALLPTVRMIIPLRHPIELFASYLRRLPNRRLMRSPDQVFRSYAAYHSKILQVVERHREQCYVFYAQAAYKNLGCLQDSLERFLRVELKFSEATHNFHQEDFTDLGLGLAEHESFAKFFPAPAACFDSLNSRADISFAGDREQPKSRPELSILNRLAEFLNSPEDAADCTPVFFRVVAPSSEGYSQYLARHMDELTRTVSWLEEQVNSRGSAMDDLKTSLDQQRQYMLELESVKQYFIGQLEQHARELDQQRGYVLELESAKQYFIGQLEQHAKELDQQKHYILELESVNTRDQDRIRIQEESIRALRTRKEAFRTLLGLRQTEGG